MIFTIKIFSFQDHKIVLHENISKNIKLLFVTQMHFFSRNLVKLTLKWGKRSKEVKSIFFYNFFSSKWLCPEAIIWRYSVKRCSQKFLKTSKKTHHKSLQLYKKEAEIFSRTFWEFLENGYFTEYLRTTVSSRQHPTVSFPFWAVNLPRDISICQEITRTSIYLFKGRWND